MKLTRFLDSVFPYPCEQAGTDGGAGGGNGTTAGAAAAASASGNSASASVPVSTGGGDQGTTPDFKTSLGDFAKDPMFADIKDAQGLAKMYSDTKKLVGQKLGIPGKDATPEARNAFYEALGVPKDAAGYDFKTPDNLPEAIKSTYDQKHADKWAARMKELGIPKEAANALRNDFLAEVSEEVKGMQADIDKSDAEFAKIATSIFGDEAKTKEALQSARTMIEKHVPAEIKGALDQLSNSALLAVAVAINKEKAALNGGEDKTIGSEQGNASSGKTIAELREESRKLMADPAYNNPLSNRARHDEIQKTIKDNYAQIALLEKAGAGKK